MQKNKPTKIQLAWFAGFYEGEGYVSNDKSNNNRLKLGISQNDPTPLYLAQKFWGGSVRKRIRKSPASDKICTGYAWSLNHNPSLKFIEDIKPYMIIPYKIGQIDKALTKLDEPVNVRYKCSFCDSTFASASGRRRHEKTQHIEKGKLFECDIQGCSKTYKSRDSMSRHKRLDHTKVEIEHVSVDNLTSMLQDISLTKISTTTVFEKL